MSRNEKSNYQRMMRENPQGYTMQVFESPQLIEKAKADRGHYRMTRKEVIAHRLPGRRAKQGWQIDDTIQSRRSSKLGWLRKGK